MTYSQTDIYDIIANATCASTTVGFTSLKAEMFNQSCQKCLLKKTIYLNNLIKVLSRYYNQPTDDKCLSSTELQLVIDNINQLCDCDCCQDLADKMADIPSSWVI